MTGVIRAIPEDFRVDEVLPFVPDGEGEHALLQIEKRNSNTDWVAGLLARHAGVPRRDVSYAGMKDRNAVTRQWFSVRLAGRPAPDWSALDSPALRVLQHSRHGRKLRTGALTGNRFQLRVRELQGDGARLAQCLGQLADRGMPNYFGSQRFGHDGANLEAALALFEGRLRRIKRQQRSIYLSAARSLLFNRVLAARVAAGNWDQALPGEWLMLDGSRSGFRLELLDETIRQRLARHDIHPSGPMWGRGDPVAADQAAALERTVLADAATWRAGLEAAGLKQERRALRAPVRELEWTLEKDQLLLSFFLPKGSFATSLLRECVR